MARPNDKELSKIILFRQYATYRGVYDIYSKTSELSVDDVFRKTILIIMNWMIDRIRPFDFPVSPRLQAIIDDYPSVEEFKTFSLFEDDEKNYYQRSCDDMLDIFISYIRNTGEWSMRITEIDNGSEKVQDKYPLRTFINDFALRKDKDKVVFAFQTFCREPLEYSERAAVFKPACMRLFYDDNDFIVSEGGLSKQYPCNRPVFLNSKSDQDCRRLFDEVINNEKRQKPVLLCPRDTQQKLLMNKIAGYAMAVFEDEDDRSFAKLLKLLKKTEYIQKVGGGYYVCIDPIGKEDSVCDTDLASSRIRTQLIASNQEVYQYAWNYTRDVYIDNEFDFHKCLFARKVKDKRENLLSEQADSELHDSLLEKIKELESEKETHISRHSTDEEKLQTNIDLLSKADKEIQKLSREKTELQNESDRLKRDLERLKEKIDQLEESFGNKNEQNNQIIKELKENQQVIWKSCLPFVRSMYPRKATDILPWIKQNFGEDIIVSDDVSENKFIEEMSNKPLETFCDAIVYLWACNKSKFENGEKVFFEMLKQQLKFKEERTANEEEYRRDKKLRRNFINTLKYDEKGKEKAFLNYHVKHAANSNSSFRIYYLYADGIKKIIIGSMPEHLPTKGDNYGYNTKITK